MCAMAFELELDSSAWYVHEVQVQMSEDTTPVSETTGDWSDWSVGFLILWFRTSGHFPDLLFQAHVVWMDIRYMMSSNFYNSEATPGNKLAFWGQTQTAIYNP